MTKLKTWLRRKFQLKNLKNEMFLLKERVDMAKRPIKRVLLILKLILKFLVAAN